MLHEFARAVSEGEQRVRGSIAAPGTHRGGPEARLSPRCGPGEAPTRSPRLSCARMLRLATWTLSGSRGGCSPSMRSAGGRTSTAARGWRRVVRQQRHAARHRLRWSCAEHCPARTRSPESGYSASRPGETCPRRPFGRYSAETTSSATRAISSNCCGLAGIVLLCHARTNRPDCRQRRSEGSS